MKTVAQVTAELNKVYDGPTATKNDMTYIPWNEALKVANEVFGVDGYDVELQDVHLEKIPNLKGEWGFSYVAKVRVTVYTTDGRPFYRDGEGSNDVEFTKEKQGKNKYGEEYYIPSRAMTDTAAKGAASDALNRALKLFGPRFGLNLYDKDKPEGGSSNGNGASSGASRQSSSNGDTNRDWRTAGRRKFLSDLGYSDEDIDGMAFERGQEIMNGKIRKPSAEAPAKAAPRKAAPAQPAQPDDLDEFFQ